MCGQKIQTPPTGFLAVINMILLKHFRGADVRGSVFNNSGSFRKRGRGIFFIIREFLSVFVLSQFCLKSLTAWNKFEIKITLHSAVPV